MAQVKRKDASLSAWDFYSGQGSLLADELACIFLVRCVHCCRTAPLAPTAAPFASANGAAEVSALYFAFKTWVNDQVRVEHKKLARASTSAFFSFCDDPPLSSNFSRCVCASHLSVCLPLPALLLCLAFLLCLIPETKRLPVNLSFDFIRCFGVLT
jgi:hypothetical protein